MHHPEVRAMVKRTSGAIRASGKIPGTLVTADTVAEFVLAGCRFLYEHANNFTVNGATDFRQRLPKAQKGDAL
jgi:4-hydroxy-2-oxoheptanedioate aldolase